MDVNITDSSNCSSQTISSTMKCHYDCPTDGYSRSNPFGSCRFGVWTPPSECSANPCTNISQPLNGDYGACSDSLASGEQCSFACNQGYYISGPTICQAGTLVSEGVCVENPCTNVLPPANGDIGSCQSTLPSGETCMFGCDSGFTLTNPTTCNSSILISGRCDPNPCLNISAPSHGSMGMCTSTLNSNDSCTFQCNSGYSLSSPTSCLNGELITVGSCLETNVNSQELLRSHWIQEHVLLRLNISRIALYNARTDILCLDLINAKLVI